MMGTLFITVIAFVNLWGYSELKAALAISPIPLMGLLVAPIVGRLANRVEPRFLGIPALLMMSGGLFWLSTFPAEPYYMSVLPPLLLMGAGVGATFPAVSIGSMGSIRGTELGLGSGIVNMARQVGFAVGVALLVAVFTGTVNNEVKDAHRQVASLTRDSGLSVAQHTRLERRVFRDPKNPSVQAPKGPETPVEQRAKRIVDEHLRNAFAAALRVAAFVTLLGIPFALTMRRRPGEAHAVEAVAAAG
jgi:MFS family permease